MKLGALNYSYNKGEGSIKLNDMFNENISAGDRVICLDILTDWINILQEKYDNMLEQKGE